MASNMWTSNRRLYLDKNGTVVEADDPARVSLLVAQGGTIPLADAERYGLVTVTPAVIETVMPEDEKGKESAPNKAKSRAPENKGK